MTRTHRSAKTIGTATETDVANYLAEQLDDNRIDRQVKHGNNDRGDIAGVRIRGERLVIEVKNVTHETCLKCGRVTGLKLPEWTNEAKLEAGNADALAGIVVSKRKGTTDVGRYWVHMTVAELIALITGERQPL